MRRGLFIGIISLFLFTTLAFAGAEGEVISIDKDDNGNIRVWTSYKVDGIMVESLYPKINGKFVYCSRYNAMNFLGMTDVEIKARILQDVDSHTKSLIRNTCVREANKKIEFKDVIGSKVTNQTTTVRINEKDCILNTDGSITPVQ